MKILHINSYYSTSLFYKNLFDRQHKKKINIDVFVPVNSNIKLRDFDFGEYTLISKNHTKYDRLIFHIKHYKIYKDIQKKYNLEEFSLIHAHSLFSNGYIAMKLKKRYGIQYIVTVRNTDLNVFFEKMIFLRKIGIEILKEAKYIVFLSKPYEKQVLEKYVPKSLKTIIQKKIRIVPNGIDDFWYEHIASPKKQPDRLKLKLLHIGDINKNKNIETTVKAVDILMKKGYRVELDVVGKVKDKQVLNKIIGFDFVNYLGYKPKEDLIKVYQENDVFVLPSINETFGLVYGEAMSQGLPVIYTRGQGFDEQFKEGQVGYSVDCFNEKEVANKILHVLDNFEKISYNCIQKTTRFNWETITQQYYQLYKLMNENNLGE